MRIQKIYIDTSVIGGYFDKEFDIATQRLFDEVIQNCSFQYN